MPQKLQAPVVNVLQPENSAILRCPDDVLKIIFELANDFPDEETMIWHYIFKDNERHRFRMARDISHVCRKWRAVSLNMPYLWFRIMIDCRRRKPPSAIEAFWERSCSRVKSVPATISIRASFSTDPYQLDDIGKIPVIQSLRIKLPDKQSFPTVLNLLDQAKSPELEIQNNQEAQLPLYSPRTIGHGIQELRVSGYNYIDIQESDPTWEIGELLSRLPSLQTLQITEYGSLGLRKPLYHPLYNLDIVNVASLDLFPILACLPQLRKLRLDDVRGLTSSMESLIELPHLNTLELGLRHKQRTDWLIELSCPALHKLLINQNYIMGFHPAATSELLSFISSHCSIKSFHLTICPLLLVQLGSIAPQIEELSLKFIPNELEELSRGLLTNLRILRITDPWHTLTSSAFEQLVKTRCLPSFHPRSQLIPGLSPLAELNVKYRKITTKLLPPQTWLGSKLIRDASSIIIKKDTEAWFSWVDWKGLSSS